MSKKIKTLDDIRAAVAQQLAAHYRNGAADVADAWATDFRKHVLHNAYALLGLDQTFGEIRWRDSSPLHTQLAEFAKTSLTTILEEAKPALDAQLAKDRPKLNRAIKKAFRETVQYRISRLATDYADRQLHEIVRQEVADLADRVFAELTGSQGDENESENKSKSEDDHA